MPRAERRERAALFRYGGLTLTDDRLVGAYELDGVPFTEAVTFSGVPSLRRPDVRALAELWYLLAGLSYYKAGAARALDLGPTPVTPAGRVLLRAAIDDGLAEFAYRNDLDLSDVAVTGGADASAPTAAGPLTRVLVPFGGGIDSVVTQATLAADIDAPLFIVSPVTGRFDPLEQTAAVTGRAVVRAERAVDAQILRRDPAHFQGHVPVTAFIALLAAVAAVADDRGGVVMSNEHAASAPALTWAGRSVNHQWSKSADAEVLIDAAVGERVRGFTVASALRNRSELWVAERFSALPAFHRTFRSCNRAFAADPIRRAASWCGTCDKCVFIDLVLAPFFEREHLREVLGVEPLSDPRCALQLAALVGAPGTDRPLECVGDVTECAAAVVALAALPAWRTEPAIAALAATLNPTANVGALLEPRGESRAPAAWLR